MRRVAFILALCLAACTGTSPEPDYYELAAIDGAAQPGLAASIKIERPSLPEYLDRPDIVRQENAYQYKIDEFRRWAEPLDRMFERILAEDLRQRLPDCAILTEADTGTEDMRYSIETAIEQFNAVDPNTTALKVTLSVQDKTGARKFEPQSLAFTAPADATVSGLAAALSKLIGEYADRIQAVIKDNH